MPKLLDIRVTKKIKLAGIPESEVEIYNSLLFGDVIGGPDVEVDKKALISMAKIIKSWNLTDEAGTTLPITEATLARLPIEAGESLVIQTNEFMQSKKNSQTEQST